MNLKLALVVEQQGELSSYFCIIQHGNFVAWNTCLIVGIFVKLNQRLNKRPQLSGAQMFSLIKVFA